MVVIISMLVFWIVKPCGPAGKYEPLEKHTVPYLGLKRGDQDLNCSYSIWRMTSPQLTKQWDDLGKQEVSPYRQPEKKALLPFIPLSTSSLICFSTLSPLQSASPFSPQLSTEHPFFSTYCHRFALPLVLWSNHHEFYPNQEEKSDFSFLASYRATFFLLFSPTPGILGFWMVAGRLSTWPLPTLHGPSSIPI